MFEESTRGRIRMYRHVLSSRILGVLCLTVLAVAGPDCLPKRVYWSPDGQQAVILGDKQVYVASAEGQISSPVQTAFEQVAWLPDSRHFVAVQQQALSNWAQVQRALSPEQAGKVVALSDEFYEQIMAHEGSWDNWQPRLPKELSGNEFVSLWIHVREKHESELRNKLGADWERFSSLALTLRVLQLFGLQEGGVLQSGRVLDQTLHDFGVGSLHVSPDGTMAAYVVRQPGESDKAEGQKADASDLGGTLLLVSLSEETEPQVVAPFAAWRSDFTADSRSLVYATAKPMPQGESLVLGSIERRTVRNEAGRTQFLEPEHLAGIMYFPNTKIVCLDDGRILFSAADVKLPMAASDVITGPSLFSMDPGRRATIAPMMTVSATANAPKDGFENGVFDVRPDGLAVTLVEIGDDGQVAYYSFPKGDLVTVASTKGWKLVEQPAWRNNEELSFVVPPGHEWGSAERPELVLYNVESRQGRAISKSWPEELMKTFMPGRAQTQPAQPEPMPAEEQATKGGGQ